MSRLDAKQTSFIAMMSALGTVLSVISLNVAPILRAVSGEGGAALDLSHIATFIAAIFGGPYTGAIVGFLSGIYSGYYIGYVMGSLGLLSLAGVPIGKAVTGLTAGLLYKKLRVNSSSQPSTLTALVTLLSYIPECLYTIFYFLRIVFYVYGDAMEFMLPIVIPKAWIEILFMSFLMGALVGNTGFKEFIFRFFYSPKFERPISASEK
ncbi:MAG: ECF transporter S component [Thermoproteota archaeon]|nr:ECF transporter S component [Thermoproteota archaeon]